MNKKIGILLILLVLIGVTGCGKKEKEVTPDTVKKSVKAIKIEQKDISEISMSSGTLDALNEAVETTKTGGDVVKIYHTNGDAVKKGQLILELTNPDVESTYRDAKSALNSSQVQLEITKTRYNKFKTLYKEELISEDEFLNIKNTYIGSVSKLDVAKARFYKANDNYKKLKLRSKIDGVVADLDVKRYENIMPNTKLFRVVDISKLTLTTGVSAKFIALLKKGAKADLMVEGFEKSFKGTVYEINPVIDTNTMKYKVKLLIESRDGSLKQGMFARVKLVTGKKKGFIISKQAIMVEDLYTYVVVLEKKQVEVVENGEKVKKEEYVSRKIRVKEGYANDDMQEIVSDELKDGMEIVVSGQYSLEDDDIVTIN
jgi:RND family efflux transporter MFP subunit